MENCKTVRKVTPGFANSMFLFTLIFFVLGSLGISIILKILKIKLGMIPSLVLSQALIWCGVLIYSLIGRRNPFVLSDFKIKTGPGKFILTAILAFVFTGCIMPTTWLLNLLSQFFVDNAMEEVTGGILSYSLPIQLLVIAVMPAVSEELLCRGAFFGGLKRTSILKGAIISGLFFGMLHLNINQFCYAAFLGIVLALLNEATGCIYTSMMAHFMINGTSVVLNWVMNNVSVFTEATNEAEQVALSDLSIAQKLVYVIVYGVMAVIGLVMAALVLWGIMALNKRTAHFLGIFKKNAKNPYSYEEETEEGIQIKKKSMFNVWFWVSVVLGFGYMILFEFILV